MNEGIKKRLASLALASVMTINMSGCKSSEKSQNGSSSTTNFEIVTEVDENVNEINSTKCYSSKNIYVVTATTLSGDKVTYLATPYSTFTEVYYLELITGCAIERVNKTTELVKYLDVKELKEEYTESEIMGLYSQIVDSNVPKLEYPVSRYADCPVEKPQEEEYKAAYLHLFVGKDNDGKEELYLVRHKNTLLNAEIYDFFTDIQLNRYYEFISSSEWAPLCEYIPLPDRKEIYTSEELKVILDYARQVFHKNRDFNSNLSIGLLSLGQKYSEEQVLVLDTSKLINFGEVEDQKKVHILLLTSANEDKTGFNYSELGSSNNVATLIIDENGYTLCYSEKENGVTYIVDSVLDEDALLPLNEFLAKNGYEDSIKEEAFTGEELQTLEQGLQNRKVLTLSKEKN